MLDVTDEADIKSQFKTTAEPTLTITKKQSVLEWLRDIAYTNRLTWQRNSNNTVVLWSEPDIISLMRHITDEAFAQQPQLEAEVKPILHDKLDPGLVARLDAEPTKWSQFIRQHVFSSRH
jgi:hypothetical protein